MLINDENVPIEYIGAIEAILFAAGEPISAEDIAGVLRIGPADVADALVELERKLSAPTSGLQLNKVAGGYQLTTRAEIFPLLERLNQVVDRKLSAPTMETLAIIAFKQPITKGEIETIRGVRVERALQKLLDLELVVEVGRKHVLGRPILYGTTSRFLTCFGLNSIADLPQLPSNEEAIAGLDGAQLDLFNELNEECGSHGNDEPIDEDV